MRGAFEGLVYSVLKTLSAFILAAFVFFSALVALGY